MSAKKKIKEVNSLNAGACGRAGASTQHISRFKLKGLRHSAAQVEWIMSFSFTFIKLIVCSPTPVVTVTKPGHASQVKLNSVFNYSGKCLPFQTKANKCWRFTEVVHVVHNGNWTVIWRFFFMKQHWNSPVLHDLALRMVPFSPY